MAYQQATEKQKQMLAVLEAEFDVVRNLIRSYTNNGRRANVALTHLETAEMYANKSIVKGDK